MTNSESHDIVDFRVELDAIRQKYGPRFHCEENAVIDAAALWGAHCNAHGVLDQITEKISVKHKGYSATIRLYRTAKGYWHIALDFTAPDSGLCTPASVWSGIAYASDLVARRAAIECLLNRRAVRADGADLRTFRAKLEAELTPQLALF